jgi:group I intron endonuclease
MYNCFMAIIYKITNTINNKSYIGFTVKSAEHRLKIHIRSAQSGWNSILHKAIRKYGKENFIVEVLEESDDEKFLLNEREQYYIEKYDTFNNGYNMTLGGEGSSGFKHKSETKKLISDQYKERWKNPDFLEKQKNNPRMKDKKHSEETKKKMKNKRFNHTQATKQILSEYFSQKWKIIHPDGREEIIINLREFCRKNNYNRSHLYQVAKGRIKSYKGIKCIKL